MAVLLYSLSLSLSRARMRARAEVVAKAATDLLLVWYKMSYRANKHLFLFFCSQTAAHLSSISAPSPVSPMTRFQSCLATIQWVLWIEIHHEVALFSVAVAVHKQRRLLVDNLMFNVQLADVSTRCSSHSQGKRCIIPNIKLSTRNLCCFYTQCHAWDYPWELLQSVSNLLNQ